MVGIKMGCTKRASFCILCPFSKKICLGMGKRTLHYLLGLKDIPRTFVVAELFAEDLGLGAAWIFLDSLVLLGYSRELGAAWIFLDSLVLGIPESLVLLGYS